MPLGYRNERRERSIQLRRKALERIVAEAKAGVPEIFVPFYEQKIKEFLLTLFIVQVFCTEHFDEGYPFLVKIEAKGNVPECAGTIQARCTVLTSAHCVEGVKPSEVTVTHFTTKPTKYNVAAVLIHPKYNSSILANDIALLRLERSFEEPYSTVSLSNMPKEKLFSRCNVMEIVGWSGQIMNDPLKSHKFSETSATTPEKPMRASVTLISKENCTSLIKNFGGIFQGEEKLCGVTSEEAEEEEGCFTGPGGPLLCSFNSPISKESSKRMSPPQKVHYTDKNGTLADPIDLSESLNNFNEKKFKRETESDVKNLQVGVVSWGKSCSKSPSVYSETNEFYEWITINTEDDCEVDFEDCKFLTPLSGKGAKSIYFTILNTVTFSMFITFLSSFL